MTQFIIDRQLRTRLHDLHERLEFVDESGNLLGYFLPISTGETPHIDEALITDVQPTHAELLQMAQRKPPPQHWFEDDEPCPFVPGDRE